MKHIPFLAIAAAALLVPTAHAQDAADDQPDRAQRRQRVIAAFDADGDGQLNDEERAKAREELSGVTDRADRPRRERDRDRGREGLGPRPDGPPDFGRLFERFDENGDDQLSRDEFTKLTDTLREMRERWGAGPPDGRGRADRGDRPGPPPGPADDGTDRPRRRRGEFGDSDRFRPLQNPGPPPEEERGYRGPQGDRGGRGARGEGRGLEAMGMGRPNPERMFRASDANDDGQLSLDEFRDMTARMRERMGDFRGRGGPPDEGGRGRYRRPGSPDGPPGPPRPPRPEFESVNPSEAKPEADPNSA